MNRTKLFIENFFVYGLGSVMSKIVPLIMLPIVTRLMPNSYYYGLNDISNIVISFGSAIAILGMYDAMFRLFFDKQDIKFKKNVCSSAFYFVTLTSFIIFLIIMIFRPFFSNLFFSDSKYTNLLIITALNVLVGANSSIVSAPTRMENKRKVFLITNTLAPILSYSISVPLLMKGMYISALPFASLISSLSMLIIFLKLNGHWFNFKYVDKKIIKELLMLGLPLVPNFLIYWIFNSCDRMFIAKILGNSQVGIYGVGVRVAQISQFIYTAFAGGWQYFAFSTMKNDDQMQMVSRIFEYLGIISFSATVFLTSISGLIFKILFTGVYVKGAIVFPYMFLSPLLLMLYQTIGNQFLVKKKTGPSAIILSIGAIINIVFNYALLPIIGIEGAALATLLGYATSVIICERVLNKMKMIKISRKFKTCSVVTIIYFVLWRLVTKDNIIVSCMLSLFIIYLYTIFYKKELKKLFEKCNNIRKKKLTKEHN